MAALQRDMSTAVAASPAVELDDMHCTTRARVPPQAVSQGPHAATAYDSVTQARVLHARLVSGIAPAPAHSVAATTAPPAVAVQLTLRRLMPPPHAALHAAQSLVTLHWYAADVAGTHGRPAHASDRCAAGSHADSGCGADALAEPTHVAVRVRVPICPHAAEHAE